MRDSPADLPSTLPGDHGSPQRPSAPAQIGRFVVLSTLGAGGMGVVYSAYDEELDRRVAVKLLEGQGDPDAQRRVQRYGVSFPQPSPGGAS